MADPRHMVQIEYIYADKCKECEMATSMIETFLEEENCSASLRKLFYLDNETIRFCIDNSIDDIPSCIIGSKYKFVGWKSFTKEAIKKAISRSKTLIDDES